MSKIKLQATDGNGGTISLKGPTTTDGNAEFELTLPANDGSANQYLKTDGSGALSWSTVSAGTTLTGSTDNTICTVTGANAIAGEANLTFDGNAVFTQKLTATNTYTYSLGNNNGIKLEWSIDNGATWHRAKTNNYKNNGATNTNDRLLQNGVTRCALVNSEGDGKTKAKGKYIMLRIVHVSLGTTSAMEIADISLIYRQKKVK